MDIVGTVPSLEATTMLLFVLVAWVLGRASAECHNGTIIDSGLTCEEKQLIVNLHNDLRNLVAGGDLETQPTAENMIEMRWSEPVAETAQAWGDRCVFEHDQDRKLDGQLLGQNLAIWSYSEAQNSTDPASRMADIKGLVKLWSDEVIEYGYNGTYDPPSGHYSQMIWGSSTHVGCGLTYYDQEGTFVVYLVCNYSPPGNWIGLPPYVYGNKTCEAYNLYESTSYSDLCATDKKKVLVCNEEKKKIEKGQENEKSEEGKKKEDLVNVEDGNNDVKKENGNEKEELVKHVDQTKEDTLQQEGDKTNEELIKQEGEETKEELIQEDIETGVEMKKEKEETGKKTADEKKDVKKEDLIEEGVKKLEKEKIGNITKSDVNIDNVDSKSNCICTCK